MCQQNNGQETRRGTLKAEYPNVQKYMKTCLTSLLMRKIQNTITMKYLYAPRRMVKI